MELAPMELERAARRVDEVGIALIEVANRLAASSPPAAIFGADGAGALGELGRALAAQASGAIAARAAESTALGDAASALASTIATGTAAIRSLDDHHGRSARPGGA